MRKLRLKEVKGHAHISQSRTSVRVGTPALRLLAPLLLGTRNKTLFCVLAGMPFGEPPNDEEARQRAGRGGMPPPP